MKDCLIAVLAMAACVLAASAWSKLRSRQAYLAFRSGLREASLVSARLLPVTASALAAAETIIALGLAAAAVAVPAAAPGASALAASALAAAAGLMAVLVAGVAVVVRRGTRTRCACFGASSRPLGAAHLVRNACLLTVLMAGLVAVPLAGGRTVAAGILLAAAAGLTAALLFVRWDDLAELFAPISPDRSGSGSSSSSSSGRSPV